MYRSDNALTRNTNNNEKNKNEIDAENKFQLQTENDIYNTHYSRPNYEQNAPALLVRQTILNEYERRTEFE